MNTTAAFNYLATLYERALGRGLDLTAIRLFWQSKAFAAPVPR